MAEAGPNHRVGAIERVGPDGFIVEAAEPDDPAFYNGKRLFPNFDSLLQFLAQHFYVIKGAGATHGVKSKSLTQEEVAEEAVKLKEELKTVRRGVGFTDNSMPMEVRS